MVSLLRGLYKSQFYFKVKKCIAAPKIGRFKGPYKLHLGCGKIKLDGWINVDLNSKLADVDLVWDVSMGIPVDDATCLFIYCEHLIEHLTAEQGARFLRECNRVLRAGGVLRIATPSLDHMIDKICRGDWRDQDWLSQPEYRFIQTRAEMLNIAFHWWGHQWLYDREELHRRLKEAGFRSIDDLAWGTSNNAELRNLERRKDSLLICEAQKT
ncbi:MAG TPA: methyltransferase domain-containing protein [Nitrospirota bacterium]|nr:methyltransferase domain-containing protein [Nitrospirota bacterium]